MSFEVFNVIFVVDLVVSIEICGLSGEFEEKLVHSFLVSFGFWG